MFEIDKEKTIRLTRGDVATIQVSAMVSNSENYEFVKGDVVRFRVFEKKDCSVVVMQKDTIVSEASTVVYIALTKDDTKIGEVISKPKEYWYEVELNPDTEPQTIIGYDEDGPKLFKLFPEGSDVNE